MDSDFNEKYPNFKYHHPPNFCADEIERDEIRKGEKRDCRAELQQRQRNSINGSSAEWR